MGAAVYPLLEWASAIGMPVVQTEQLLNNVVKELGLLWLHKRGEKDERDFVKFNWYSTNTLNK